MMRLIMAHGKGSFASLHRPRPAPAVARLARAVSPGGVSGSAAQVTLQGPRWHERTCG